MNIFSRGFLVATGERAVKTFAQSLAALLAASGTGLLSLDWVGGLSVAGAAAAVSVLTSVGSASFGPAGPSLANEGIEPAGRFDPVEPAAVPAARTA